MPEQNKFIEFDSKCEDCGNHFASDYIEFHKRERCLKKPFNLDNLPEFRQQLRKKEKENRVESVDLPVPEKKLPAILQNQDLIFDALNEIRRKKENLSPCPHCNVNVKQKGLKKHFSKCPTLKSKINTQKILLQKNQKNKNVGEKLSDCKYCSLKLKTKNLQNHISAFHSSATFEPRKAKHIGGISICSNCKGRYSALALKCPQCDTHTTKIKVLAPINKTFRCRQCGWLTMYATSNCQSCGDK